MIVEDWARENIMKINKKKSGVIFHIKRKVKRKAGGSHQFEGYPIKEEYKYLGITIDNKMSFTKQLDNLEGKIKKGMKIINIMKWKKTSSWKLYHIWMTYVVPHFAYGALVF